MQLEVDKESRWLEITALALSTLAVLYSSGQQQVTVVQQSSGSGSSVSPATTVTSIAALVSVVGTSLLYARADHAHDHGVLTATTGLGVGLHGDVTTTTPGFMTAADKVKLNNLPTKIQSGFSVCAAGVTPVIAADVTVNTRIVVGIKIPNPGAGNLTVNYAALDANRIIGAPGSFLITALLADGTINVLDTSQVDWIAIG